MSLRIRKAILSLPQLYRNWTVRAAIRPHNFRAVSQLDKFWTSSGATRLERQFTGALFPALWLRLSRTCGLGNGGILRLQIRPELGKSDLKIFTGGAALRVFGEQALF